MISGKSNTVTARSGLAGLRRAQRTRSMVTCGTLSPSGCSGQGQHSGDELADTAGLLDAGLGLLGELLGLDDAGHLGEFAGSEDLEVALYNY